MALASITHLSASDGGRSSRAPLTAATRSGRSRRRTPPSFLWRCRLTVATCSSAAIAKRRPATSTSWISKAECRPFARSEADKLPGAFSPDGRWIAYSSDESGRAEIYVRPASGAAGRWQISVEGGIDPRWALPDEIAYLQGSRIMGVSVKATPAFSAGTPRLLVDRNASDFDLARDGRILIAEAPDAASPGRLNVVVNWFEELRRR